MKQKRITYLKVIALTCAVWATVILTTPSSKVPVALAGEPQTPTPNAVNNDRLVWLDDYNTAIKEAKATGKPIFLEFRCAP